MNKDRPKLSAAKYRSIILVSRNVRHVRIFARVPWGGGVKRMWVVEERTVYRCYSLYVRKLLTGYTGYIAHNIQPFNGLSLVPKAWPWMNLQ